MIRPEDIAEAVRMLLRISPACVIPEIIFSGPARRSPKDGLGPTSGRSVGSRRPPTCACSVPALAPSDALVVVVAAHQTRPGPAGAPGEL